jgi:arsenate reductase (thioredoxin)
VDRKDEQVDRMTQSRPVQTRVLFLCTGNSCRSQMAQAWANSIYPESIEAHSAGIETHGLNPRAVQVMAEAGVDISGHRSRNIDEFDLYSFDFIITVCDHAHESCPLVPPGCRLIHESFDDPPRLAQKLRKEEEILACYRKVRDQIKNYVQNLPDHLAKENVEK